MRNNSSQEVRRFKFISGCVATPAFFMANVAIVLLLSGLAWNSNIKAFISEILLAILFALILYICCRHIEQSPWSFLGIGTDKKAGCFNFSLGLGIAGVLLSLIFLFELTNGWIKYSWIWQQSQHPSSNILFDAFIEFLTMGVIAAWIEELVFRGYILKALEDSRNNCYSAIIFSSFFFGLMHAVLCIKLFWGALICTFLLGVLLALGRYFTQSLWLSIGLHLGWNIFEGIIFGFPVSGNSDFLNCHFICQVTPHQLLTIEVLFTGGEYGPEAGITGCVAAILGCISLCFLSKRFRWSMRQL